MKAHNVKALHIELAQGFPINSQKFAKLKGACP